MTMTEKDKKQLAIISVLAIALIIATQSSFSQIKKSREKYKKSLQKAPAASVTVTSQNQPQSAITFQSAPAMVLAQQTSTGVDPFSGRQINIGLDDGTPSSFRLTGIVFNPKDPASSYAIINNEVVKVGEEIGNTKIKVVDINTEEVTLSDGKSTMKLKTW